MSAYVVYVTSYVQLSTLQRKEVGGAGWGGKEEETKERKKNESKNKIKHRKEKRKLFFLMLFLSSKISLEWLINF